MKPSVSKPTSTTNNSSIFKNIAAVGIVCIDNVRLSPIAEVMLNRMAVESKNPKIRQINFYSAGFQRSSVKMADSTKGFLQKNGFDTSSLHDPERISKDWLVTKDIILTMDKFIRRDILHDYFPVVAPEWEEKILVFNEAVGISDRIRDPGNDPLAETTPVYELVKKCCEALILLLEKSNP
jgi:protein-tyrosine-phosphatase